METLHYDALIIGAGFGGIYQLYALRQLGLSVRVIDVASDLGGTWYWNRYPGAMSDTHSFIYRYSWDKEDLESFPWPNNYLKQEEILGYLHHVVDKYDLRKHMQFETEMLSSDWIEDEGQWRVRCSTDQEFAVRYLVTAMGILSRKNFPDIPGLDTFSGELVHTAAWDPELTVANKRVGILGCGSTGTQVLNAIAPEVKSLHAFIRHPQYSVPTGFRPVTEDERQDINRRYDEIWDQVRSSRTAFGFPEATRKTMSVSAEERERIFEELWQEGNGFKFMFGGFGDIITDEEANEAACQFVRKKISQMVKDPTTAAILTPTDYYARRPMCDSGFYYQFNRDNVHAVDLKQTSITSISSEGIHTADGKLYSLDMIIFATGFDAFEGNYTRVRIRGRRGKTIQDHWASGPTSFLGIFVPDFPNLFMINGPNGPFCNVPPSVETSVNFISDAISRAEASRRESEQRGIVEVLPEAELEWCQECQQAADGNLFQKMSSWLFGANIPGKPPSTRFYFGGLGRMRERMEAVKTDGWQQFKPL